MWMETALNGYRSPQLCAWKFICVLATDPPAQNGAGHIVMNNYLIKYLLHASDTTPLRIELEKRPANM